jgi:hypothetical protein
MYVAPINVCCVCKIYRQRYLGCLWFLQAICVGQTKSALRPVIVTLLDFSIKALIE